MRLSAILIATAGATLAHEDECCWCDPNTPKAARTIVGSDSQIYKLVFSDEFDDSNRNFANGHDTKWTALDIGDTSNKGAAFYLPEQAEVLEDKDFGVTSLRILTEAKNHTGDSPTGEKGIFMPYRSAMLQSWNKFCFTGGILEFRARLPRGGGYWPALWAFGNLGRAVYQNSNTGLWPWSYDECDPDLQLPPTDPPQRISACDDHDFTSEGLLPFQGRGATELDVLEGAVTNQGFGSYGVGSVQLSPGIPSYFRPPMFGFPTESGPGSWYSGLTFGPKGKPNNGWYGPPWGSECLTGCPDALSGGIVEIDNFDTKYWTYRMEWKVGPKGHIAWYYDGEFVWSMAGSSFGEYKICSEKPGSPTECMRTPKRQVPNEPMSLVINTAIGTWNGGASAIDNLHWPASFWVDYVRLWQHEVNIGCSPPDFPTKEYIEKNAGLYGEPVAPLGTDTCKEMYPQSAYDHADAIMERAKHVREMRQTNPHFAKAAKLAEAHRAEAEAGHEAAEKAAEAAATGGAPPVAAVVTNAPLDATVLATMGRSTPTIDFQPRSVPRTHTVARTSSEPVSEQPFESKMSLLVGAFAAAAVFAAALVYQRKRRRSYDVFQEPLASPYRGL